MEKIFRPTATLIFWLLVMALPVSAAYGQQPVDLSSLTNEFKISLWDTTATLRGTMGYKDNVELANSNRLGSAFWDSGGDLTIIRLPSGSWTFTFFGSADYTSYFTGGVVQDEEIVLAGLQESRAFSGGWSSGVGLNYIYQNQIVDNPNDQTNQSPGRVTGNDFIARWFVRKEFNSIWVQLDLSGQRGLMNAPLGDYWQFGPRLGIGYRYGPGSSLVFNYQWAYQVSDSRQQLDSQGVTLAGTTLALYMQSLDFTWHQVWDSSNHWDTSFNAGVDLNADNGPGYYNYTQYRLSTSIEYKAATWAVSAYIKAGYYDYPVQTVSDDSGELRSKTWFTAGIHVEKQALKKLKVFADYAYDRSLSDLSTDDYVDNTISAGLAWQF
ncbi:MAG: hypothetical protein ABSE48_17390 [Verrucomicrobiota bacterium]